MRPPNGRRYPAESLGNVAVAPAADNRRGMKLLRSVGFWIDDSQAIRFASNRDRNPFAGCRRRAATTTEENILVDQVARQLPLAILLFV